MSVSINSKQGFTLIELMIVIAIIAIMASLALPDLTKAKTVAGEAEAVSSLRRLAAAQSIFKNASGDYAESLEVLSGGEPNGTSLLDSALKNGRKSDYVFQVSSNTSFTWSATATPTDSDCRSGLRSFYVNQSGVIRWGTCPERPTEDSPPLKHGDQADHDDSDADSTSTAYTFLNIISAMRSLAPGVASEDDPLVATTAETIRAEGFIYDVVKGLDANRDGSISREEFSLADVLGLAKILAAKITSTNDDMRSINDDAVLSVLIQEAKDFIVGKMPAPSPEDTDSRDTEVKVSTELSPTQATQIKNLLEGVTGP